MAKGISRRTMLAGTAALLGTATGARALFAQDSRLRMDLSVRDPARLRGLEGASLRDALLGQLVIIVNGAGGAVSVGLCCVRVEDGRAGDVFLSRSFEVRDGRQGLPGAMFVPGVDVAFPSGMLLTGDTFEPGHMFFPASGVERYAAEVAVRSLRERRHDHGLFCVLVPGARIRADVPTSGVLIPGFGKFTSPRSYEGFASNPAVPGVG